MYIICRYAYAGYYKYHYISAPTHLALDPYPMNSSLCIIGGQLVPSWLSYLKFGQWYHVFVSCSSAQLANCVKTCIDTLSVGHGWVAIILVDCWTEKSKILPWRDMIIIYISVLSPIPTLSMCFCRVKYIQCSCTYTGRSKPLSF